MIKNIRTKIKKLHVIRNSILEKNSKLKDIESLITVAFEDFKNVVFEKNTSLSEQEIDLKKINNFVNDYPYSFYESFSSDKNIIKINSMTVDTRKGLLMFEKNNVNEIKIDKIYFSDDNKILRFYFESETYFNYLKFLFYDSDLMPIAPIINCYDLNLKKSVFFENYMRFYDKNIDDLYNEYYSLPKKVKYVEFVFEKPINFENSVCFFNLIEFNLNDNYVIIDIGYNIGSILTFYKNIFESVYDLTYSISSDLNNFYKINPLEVFEKNKNLLDKKLYLKIEFKLSDNKVLTNNTIEYSLKEIRKTLEDVFYVPIQYSLYDKTFFKVKINYSIYSTILKINKKLVYSENGEFFFKFKNIINEYEYDEIMENTIFSDDFKTKIKETDEFNIFLKDDKIFLPDFIYDNLLSVYLNVFDDLEYIKKCCSPFVFELKIK